MPSEVSEPTLDELSAYIDDELDASTKARVAHHVAGCADCQARVDGLRQTANAVRALPMQTPPRTFRIPAQRRQSSRNWAPVGWLGGLAAACLIVVLGVTQLHLPAGGTASAPAALQYNSNGSAAKQAEQGVAAPGASSQDSIASAARALAAGGNQVTVVDPRNTARRLTVGTDHSSYPTSGRMIVSGLLTGDSSTKNGQLRLLLRRGDYGVQLGAPTQSASTSGSSGFQGSYSLADFPLADPRAGAYTLTVMWTASDGSGATLIAELPVSLTG